MMKRILALGLFLLADFGLAEIFSSSPIVGRVTKVEAFRCPEYAQCIAPDSTVVSIEFTMRGCFDHLRIVDHRASKGAQGLYLQMRTMNVRHPKSDKVRCFVPKVVRAQMLIVGEAFEEDQVKTRFLVDAADEISLEEDLLPATFRQISLRPIPSSGQASQVRRSQSSKSAKR